MEVGPSDPAPLSSTFLEMKEMALEDIADVQTGYPFRSKVEHDPQGDLYVIQGKDIQKDFTLDYEKLTRIRLKGTARPEKKLLHKGDVIFMSRSENPYAIHLTVELPPTVVQNSFNVIRLRSPGDVLPEFLSMILNQSLMRSRIAAIVKGSTIPYIRVDDLRQIKVRLPSRKRQEALVGLEGTLRRERELHRQLEDARQQELDALILAE